MECFSTAYLFYIGLQILVVSWTCLFYSKGVFGGDITNFCQLYNLQTQCSSHGGVYDEFCLVEVLQPNRNLLIGGEHITYIPLVRHQPIYAFNFAYYAMLQCSKILPIMLIIMLKLFATVPMFCYFVMDNDKLWLMNN